MKKHKNCVFANSFGGAKTAAKREQNITSPSSQVDDVVVPRGSFDDALLASAPDASYAVDKIECSRSVVERTCPERSVYVQVVTPEPLKANDASETVVRVIDDAKEVRALETESPDIVIRPTRPKRRVVVQVVPSEPLKIDDTSETAAQVIEDVKKVRAVETESPDSLMRPTRPKRKVVVRVVTPKPLVTDASDTIVQVVDHVEEVPVVERASTLEADETMSSVCVIRPTRPKRRVKDQVVTPEPIKTDTSGTVQVVEGFEESRTVEADDSIQRTRSEQSVRATTEKTRVVEIITEVRALERTPAIGTEETESSVNVVRPTCPGQSVRVTTLASLEGLAFGVESTTDVPESLSHEEVTGFKSSTKSTGAEIASAPVGEEHM